MYDNLILTDDFKLFKLYLIMFFLSHNPLKYLNKTWKLDRHDNNLDSLKFA